jgi:mono/diheme cytochrome c family protein
MRHGIPKIAAIALALAALAVGLGGSRGDGVKERTPTAEQAAFFEKEVKPILRANCVSCHGGEEKVKGGLRLTSRAELLKGGRSGPVVSLDNPDESRILEAINYEGLKMPPKGKLPQAQIDVLTRWLKMGVPWPAEAVVKRGPPPVDDNARRFWSFRPVARPELPAVQDTAWVRNPIDAFVLAKLEAAGLRPAPPADKVALLRRVYYDLIGLPPTPQEVDAFLADDSPNAYEKVVDRLLASPHYGEHWARHWLDLVRYAESNSFERDGTKPFVWRYRDYVIRSLNADKPYDQFIREQLAGDELEPVTPDGVIATGYYRLGLWDDEPVDPVQALYDDLDDVVRTTGEVFLGLTVGCARCHDHKIDPFPQKDYYRFLAFFHGFQRYGVRSAESVAKASLRPITIEEDPPPPPVLDPKRARQLAEIEKQLAAIEEQVRPHLEGGERDDFQYEQHRERLIKKYVPKVISAEAFERYQALRKQREELKSGKAATPQALCVTEIGPVPRETFVLKRGNPQAQGDKVEPGFPSVLTTREPALPAPDPKAQTSGRRRVLAEWIASSDNPLTARVLVNRLWQYHFGRGIVRSSSNFGYGGTPPTHPELLDWLASEFVARGWKLKAMHRLVVLSNAYRMSSRRDEAAYAKDPENDLLWRFDLRRLTAEEVRDSVLAVSGNLNRKKLGGPSVYPPMPKEVLAGQSMPGAGWGKSTPEEAASRSIYVHLKRSLALPILSTFDAADPDASCPVRFVTTQPAQALGMINGDFLNEQAKVFAESVQKEAGADAAAQVRLTLRRATQRVPTEAEVERGVKFLAGLREKHQLPADEALRRFCLLALNLNEFIYLD